MRFVDSHLHLERKESARLLSLASANDTLLLTCGVDRSSSLEGLRAAEKTHTVRAFVGVHPSEALRERRIQWVPKALKRAAGVGEIGLDPSYSATGPKSVQMRAYLAQLGAAREAGKPVQVHSRGAESLCLDALAALGPRNVLMHWFQSEEKLQRVLDSGYFVSFGPSLVYSKRLQRMAAECDRSQVLTETDSPVAFEPLGGVAGPFLIPTVVFKLAELWGISFEEARLAVKGNAERFLGESEKS